MGSSGIIRAVFGALVMLGLVASPALAKKSKGFRVEKCSKAGADEIKAAHGFITKNLETILKQSGLKEKHKKKVRKKWPKISAKCIDQKPVCTKDRAVGRAHGVLSNKVSLCFEKHRTHHVYAFCYLVDTLFHEAGHAFNLGTGRVGHKEGDRIYKLGHAAKAVCKSKGADRALKK